MLSGAAWEPDCRVGVEQTLRCPTRLTRGGSAQPYCSRGHSSARPEPFEVREVAVPRPPRPMKAHSHGNVGLFFFFFFSFLKASRRPTKAPAPGIATKDGDGTLSGPRRSCGSHSPGPRRRPQASARVGTGPAGARTWDSLGSGSAGRAEGEGTAAGCPPPTREREGAGDGLRAEGEPRSPSGPKRNGPRTPRGRARGTRPRSASLRLREAEGRQPTDSPLASPR